MSRTVLAVIAALSVSACERYESTADQCLRAELFQQCMKSLPAGPAETRYNDWDEVVSACAQTAYYQALRSKSQVKQECRP